MPATTTRPGKLVCQIPSWSLGWRRGQEEGGVDETEEWDGREKGRKQRTGKTRGESRRQRGGEDIDSFDSSLNPFLVRFAEPEGFSEQRPEDRV